MLEDITHQKVNCIVCKTEVNIPIEEIRIISTDQGAMFIQDYNYICQKCGSVCERQFVSIK